MRRGYRHARGVRLVGAIIFALLLAGFITIARPSVRGAGATVTMQNTAFLPTSITVAVGTTVTWTNQDTVPHTTTSDAPGWDSGIMNKGASFSFTFAKAGAFPYHCNVHPSMHGTITVTAPVPTATSPLPTNTTAPPIATLTVRPAPTKARATQTPAPTGTAGVAIVTATLAATPVTTPVPASAIAVPDSAADASQPGPISSLPFANFLEPIRPFTDLPDHRFFAATGHSLNFGFKSYWEQNGGLAQFGMPISEEFLERGADGAARTVQYFERARFEYHYDLTTAPFAVVVGMLGREATAGRMNDPAFLPVSAATMPDGQFFAATGHTLSGLFAAFWQAGGGLPTFGYPISEPFQESDADGNSHTVQYFERYRLELHPETNGIELGRLGVQVARSRGYIPSA